MIEIQNSKIKTFYFLLVILTFTFYLLPSVAIATESTPSADPLRQNDSEASVKAKLEELKKEIASKAAKLKETVNNKLKNKAYVGLVKSKSETTLTLAALSGPKIVNINQDTVFESKTKLKSKQKFSLNTITLEDYIAAIGDIDETGTLTAKKVILLQPTKLQPKTYLWGQIISVSDQLATLKTSEQKNIAATLPPGPPVSVNNFVILTGFDKNNVFDTEFVYVIPQNSPLKPKNASASASLKEKATTASAKASFKPNSR